ncbi:MAG: transporter [Alphaproteobacteria bacterium]|nr:transporter [Alphaproteobacteria bacterium]
MTNDAVPARSSGTGHSPWFTLVVLTFIFSIGFIDRQVLNLLVPPIKKSFGLSDLQISVLQGAAFSIAYLLMSPVFGRLVDVYTRRRILLPCVLLWSGFTALCGFAGGFASLFAVRSAVGAAEAGMTPAGYSMLSDSFDETRLARAMSIYSIGTYLGSGLALLLGGLVLRSAEGWDVSGIPLLSGMQPWQLTFLVVGTIGIPCSLLLLLVREPPRRGEAADIVLGLSQAKDIIRRQRRFYGLFYLGMALSIVPVYAFPAWLPALVTRQFHVPISQVGIQYGIIVLITGTAGVLCGPSAAAWLARTGVRDQNLRLVVITNLLVLGACIALFFRPSYHAVLAFGGFASFFYSMPTPMAAAALQIATPNRMRGLITSIYIVIITIIGLGIAPVLVAFFTDKVFGDEARVGDSLALVCGFAALGAAVTLASCLPAYRALLDRAEAKTRLAAA